MTFDLSKMCNHCAANKTNVSSICMPSFIHTFTIVAEKNCVFLVKIPIFAQIMAPGDLWPSWKILNIYISGKPTSHITSVPSFKFLWSRVSEKNTMLTFWGLFHSDYCPLWPLTFVRGNQTEHIRKALIAYYHPGKFQVSVFNSVWEKCNVKVFGPCCTNYGPLWPLTFVTVTKLCIFGKPSLHTTIMPSFKILWLIVSE